MKTKVIRYDGNYKLAGKKLYLHYCGKCYTEIFSRKNNYCYHCGRKFDWKNISTVTVIKKRRNNEKSINNRH